MKKGVLENFEKFTGKHLRQSLFFKSLFYDSVYPSSSSNLENKGKPATLFLQKLWVQVFSCELCEIFENTFFAEHLRVALSALNNLRGDKFSRNVL